MPKATITSKGQLTLPKEIRSKLGVGSGDQVEFRIEDDGSILVTSTKGSAQRLFGFLHDGGQAASSIEDIDKSISEAVGADDERIRNETL